MLDFFGQLAKLYGRLCPAAAFRHELIQLAAKLLASRNKRPNLGLLVGRVKQPRARAGEHANHVVKRNSIQARGQAIEPLRRSRVAQRAQLLNLADADSEDVVVGRFINVLQRLAKKPVALLLSVRCNDRYFANIGRTAIGVTADRERARHWSRP